MGHLPVHVVDDEPEVGRLVTMALRAQGHAVDYFETGEAYLEARRERTGPHLLIVDKNMPGMSGLELVAALRDAGDRFEAIMITGYADEASAREAARLGIRAYIRKPFTLAELRQAVSEADARLGGEDQGGENQGGENQGGENQGGESQGE